MEKDPPNANSSDSELFQDAEGDTENRYFPTNPIEVDEEEDDDEDEENQKPSIISEIRKELNLPTASKSKSSSTLDTVGDDGDTSKSELGIEKPNTASGSTASTSCKNALTTSHGDNVESCEWRKEKKHIFVMSDSGKPIYSLHGNENSLAMLYGIMQALVSFVEHGEDTISSIHAYGIKFVFLMRGHLILVAASRTKMSVQQLQMQLCDVYNQILSAVPFDFNEVFEKRKNFDLRRHLEGTQHAIKKLLSCEKVDNKAFAFLTNTVRVLPLAKNIRSNIISAIQSNCSKIRGLIFALLIADNKLIALVRKKDCNMHPADLRILLNLVDSTHSFKDYEWSCRPIRLPKFDRKALSTAYAFYLAEDCQACLLLLHVAADAHVSLCEAKQKITDKLRRTHCLEAISEELKKTSNDRMNFATLGLTDLRHFLYKPRGTAQLLCPDIIRPYTRFDLFENLQQIYCKLLHRVHNPGNPMKLVYGVNSTEVVLAWMTAGYELYAVFEPLVNRSTVIKQVDKLIKFIDKEYETYFLRTPYPNF